MKAAALFKENVWLVDTISRAGRITLREINDRWLLTDDMSEGNPLSRNTFNRHRTSVEDIFGITIGCDSEVSQSERKLNNYLNKKGISKKVALIGEAISDMRGHHRLTKENLECAIENIVLVDKRDELKRTEELEKYVEDKKMRNVKNFVISYIKGIEEGEVRTSKKERCAKQSVKNWEQFRRVFLEFYEVRPFGWNDMNESLVDRYISFLESKGYMKYTLDKHKSLFKTMIGAAERQGLHTNHNAFSFLKRHQVKE